MDVLVLWVRCVHMAVRVPVPLRGWVQCMRANVLSDSLYGTATTTPAAPPPYSAPNSSTATISATTTQGAAPVALPDIALHGSSSTSLEGRMGAMEGVLQQLVAGMKRGRSLSPNGPTRSIRAHIDDAPAHSITAPTNAALAPSQPPGIVQNAHIAPPPAINTAAVAAPPAVIVQAPAPIAPPASVVHAPAIAAPPAGTVHAPAASAFPAGIVHVTSTLPAAVVHAPEGVWEFIKITY
ncbi:hypothetical protein B0H13DRAFT_1851263 [Mycena leptocephala]|nr:hypothetical protein B0H13DRAFT_1851263 [Mycena leptocephala]